MQRWTGTSALDWLRGPAGSGLRGDLVGYGASTVLAAGLALITVYHGHRIWGAAAAAGYGVAFAGSLLLLRRHRRLAGPRRRQGVLPCLPRRQGRLPCEAIVPRGRAVLAGLAGSGAIAVPLAVLVARRSGGVAWSAQPEVGVVERAAAALLAGGTTYPDLTGLGRPIGFEDYVPYLPGMALFGLPRVLAGAPAGLPAAAPPPAAAWTDPRLGFAAAGLLLLAATVAVLVRSGHPAPPLRAVQLLVLAPPTALALSTGGDDVPVLGLLVLAFTLAHARRPTAAGLAAGAALALKLSALPALVVLGIALATRHGRRGLGRYAVASAGVAIAVVAPVVLVGPGAFVEHVLRFPAGLTGVDSPAQSPLPGHLIAGTGRAGGVLALLLLGAAAAGLAGWVLTHPPADPAEAAGWAALGMAVATALMPSTRFGYLIYPVVLLGTAVLLRAPGPETGSDPPVTSSWSASPRHGRAA